ncbi:MAG: acetylglutamate kinase [Peptococcaceae bacterium]|jgi:acetylglutamate kinase|nr:acetylglutamate kinase [Peptococcaceae bacterium]MDH7525878.1 acetylglutamate kinase [Peptococcaceae bacterium]
MLSAVEKAGILMEALPYIQSFAGKTIVIKYGGHAMTDTQLEEMVLKDIIMMKLVGMNPVVVHGGGPVIDDWLKKINVEARFVNGLRVTDEITMEVVEMVLAGKVNKGIVSRINSFGGKAVGLCGKDGRLIIAEKIGGADNLGLVGEVAGVNPGIIHTLTGEGYIPVVAPVGVSLQGETLNINADYVAGALGGALKAHKLVLLTDVEGIYLGDGPESLASRLTKGEIAGLIEGGVIRGGMIPKAESCLFALEKGVENVHIVDGRKPHSLLLEIFTREGIGTMVVNE